MPTIYNRVELFRTVERVHQQAALASLNAFGVEMDHWDTARLESMPADAVSDKVYLKLVQFGEQGNAPLNVPILGATAFEVISTSVPDDLLKENPPSLLKRIQSRAFIIDGWLNTPSSKGNGPGWGKIFLEPDRPPYAVHDDDLWFVSRQPGLYIDPLSITDLGGVALVEAAFGPEALEPLSEEVCGVFIEALPLMKFRNPVWPAG